MNRILALVWGGAAIFIGYLAASIAVGPKGDAWGWMMALGFGAAAVFCALLAWRGWNEAPASPAASIGNRPSPAATATEFPGAWRGPDISLETQIEALKKAGLVMAPGRTVEELLVSWRREAYESDPYNLLLFMYGSEVEAEPWGRWFCVRGWNFDMECLTQAGDYARVFTEILRITGQPQLVTEMSDNFNLDAKLAEIRYVMDGRQRILEARVKNDWADPEAITDFVRDIEAATGDGRHFWAADNGQASILFFLTDAEAEQINRLREDILGRYVPD